MEKIGLAVTPAKLYSGPVTNRADKLVHELFSAYVGDPSVRVSLQSLVRDRLHQMRLTQAGITVNKKWVVHLSWGLAHCQCGGSSQLVGFSDDKKVKCVAFAQRE